jgi:hypothetical protein
MDYVAKLRFGTVVGSAAASSVVAALVFGSLSGPLCVSVFAQAASQVSPQLSIQASPQRSAQVPSQSSAQVSSTASGQLSTRMNGAEKSKNYAIVPDAKPIQAVALDAREIMEKSVGATEHSWQARDQFTYTELDEDRRLDSQGNVKSQNVDFTKMILVNGARFDQLVQHNGQAPSAAEQRQIDENLEKLKHETPTERSARLGKDQQNRAFLDDILAGFDFSIAGEELVGDRPAYVIQVLPQPGYHATGKYAKVFNKVAGKIWVDKQDYNWIKLDGEITQPFSMGLFIARVQSGSHVALEQTRVSDAVWEPKRLEVQGTATIFFFKTLGIDRILTYSDYLPGVDSSYSVSK